MGHFNVCGGGVEGGRRGVRSQTVTASQGGFFSLVASTHFLDTLLHIGASTYFLDTLLHIDCCYAGRITGPGG